MCVYCGSRMGKGPEYEALANELGGVIASEGMNLVYGAGSVGLMGVVARAARDAGSDVIGIIPEHLDAVEITQEGLSELHVTRNMHERKKMMFDRSDAFIVLPGGLGTLDETLEIMTWAQLSLHKKPIILLNHKGYWSPLLELINHVVTEGFASRENAALLQVAENVTEAMKLLANASPQKEASNSELM
nr:TIGR00730 family Rossman fold protein [Kordiimonas aestuarii]